jgi:hypothetical protein
MEGYWWSGKFYAIVSAIVAGESAWVGRVLAYRAGETGLEETGTSVEDYGGRLASWHWRGEAAWRSRWRWTIPMGASAMLRVCVCVRITRRRRTRRGGRRRFNQSSGMRRMSVSVCY